MVINPNPNLKQVLKEKFNIDEFRTHQEEIITDILSKRDILVLMPTGGGKSLCYQLSSVISPGFTLIISPLIALIWDQVEDLKSKNISAAAWSANLSSTELIEIKESLISGKMKILYTTPEMLVQSSHLSGLLESKSLDRIIVDEAHCVSNWGHEFRESYLELITIKKKVPNVQIVAFTATATPTVQLDIIRILNLHKVKIYRQSYIRENLHYYVQKKEFTSKLKYSESIVNQIYQWIIDNDYTRKTGIVYCLSRDNSEDLALALQKKGLSAEYFHASMETEDKRLTQNRWLSGETKIIVATIAFALGINKPNVRFVIHAALPKSIEGFYQETGRAGRDGKLSRCILFYNRQDKHILQSMTKKSESLKQLDKAEKAIKKEREREKEKEESREIERNNNKDENSDSEDSDKKIIESQGPPTDSFIRTEDMYQWANSTIDCRIESLSRYLGENVKFSCGNCDNCQQMHRNRDKTIIYKKRSITDFLELAKKLITESQSASVNKRELLKEIASNLHHYAGYNKFRVLSELEALGYLSIKYQLDKSNKIHENVVIGPQIWDERVDLLIEFEENNK